VAGERHGEPVVAGTRVGVHDEVAPGAGDLDEVISPVHLDVDRVDPVELHRSGTAVEGGGSVE
jgi:hypothetical protein